MSPNETDAALVDSVDRMAASEYSDADMVRQHHSTTPSGPLLVQRTEFVFAACEGKDVLHLGCTNWPYTASSDTDGLLLHRALSDVARRCCGLDQDQAGLDALAALGFRDLVRGDVERLDSLPEIGTFDVIVAGEIIEHLQNPGLFLRSARTRLRPGGTLIITTVNAYCAFRFIAYALKGRRGNQEPTHPDHVAYYSRATLRLLVEREGWSVRDERFYDLGNEHRRFAARWIRLANDLATKVAPQVADGVIVVCG